LIMGVVNANVNALLDLRSDTQPESSVFFGDMARNSMQSCCSYHGKLTDIMAVPVQFEVYTNTKLLWQVGYDNATSEHVFTGRLLTASGSPVGDRNVMISLNETNVVNCTNCWLCKGLSPAFTW
jgi:hypothetical protein